MSTTALEVDLYAQTCGEALHGKVKWWCLDLDLTQEPSEQQCAVLTSLERERLACYRQRADRVRFSIVRGALRQLLAQECDVDPQSIVLETDQYRRPFLRRILGSLDFNVSHSGNYGLIAMSRVGRVGVDLEESKTMDVSALLELACTSAERARLGALDEVQQRNELLQLWVQKEAILKAAGIGIASDAMPWFSVEQGRVVSERNLSFSAGHIELAPLSLPAHYLGAVALLGTSQDALLTN